MKKIVFALFTATLFNIYVNFTTVAEADVFVNYTNPPQAKVVNPNPPTAEMSPYAIINAKDGNYVISVDGYTAVIYGLYLGSQNKTRVKLDDGTSTFDHPNIPLYMILLNEMKGYKNRFYVISGTPLDMIYEKRIEEIGGKPITGIIPGENKGQINALLRNTFGSDKYCIDDLPKDPNSVLLLSLVQQITDWKFKMQKTTIKWNGYKTVPSIVGTAEVAKTTAPNGATIFHIKMEDGVVLSICFLGELDENGLGEWLHESLKFVNNKNFEKKVVNIPKINFHSEINFKEFEPLKFLFTNEAELLFGSVEQKLYDAIQKASFILDEKGIDAKAVTYAVTVSKGISLPPKPEILFDRPFVATISYVKDGKIMPTFALKLVDPSQK